MTVPLRILVPGFVIVIGIAILAVDPGLIEDVSYAFLHGLCAQTPSHTFEMGGHLLPLDARCTGIYGAALTTLAYLAWRGRLLHAALPSRPIMVVLALFVAAVGADGVNSMFETLGWRHLWTTTQATRLVTGWLSGVALGATLAWLLGSSAWRIGRNAPGIASWRDFAWVLTPLAPWGLLVGFGNDRVFSFAATVLMIAVSLVMITLAVSMVLLALHWDDRVTASQHLRKPVLVATFVGLAIVLGLAIGRYWLERTFGIPANLS